MAKENVKAKNLRRIRESKEMSQDRLSSLSGVSIRMIQYYEQGYRNINGTAALTVYKLAKALEVRPEELLELDEE